MKTPIARRLAGWFLFSAALSGIYSSTLSAKELFCAVGWLGEFTHIDPTLGQVAPTRTGLPDHLQSLAWSPDGTLLAGREGKLYTLDPLTGSTLLFLATDVDFRGMAFSASGDLYVTGGESSEPDTLRIINIEDGVCRSLGVLWGAVNEIQGLVFSPEGVLYGVVPHDHTGGTYDLVTIDLDDAETHLIRSHIGVDLSQSLAFTPDGRLYGLGETDGLDGVISSFARLDPHTGEIIGPVFTFAGDYRGLELVPEPATVLLLGFGGVMLLSRPKQSRRA